MTTSQELLDLYNQQGMEALTAAIAAALAPPPKVGLVFDDGELDFNWRFENLLDNGGGTLQAVLPAVKVGASSSVLDSIGVYLDNMDPAFRERCLTINVWVFDADKTNEIHLRGNSGVWCTPNPVGDTSISFSVVDTTVDTTVISGADLSFAGSTVSSVAGGVFTIIFVVNVHGD